MPYKVGPQWGWAVVPRRLKGPPGGQIRCKYGNFRGAGVKQGQVAGALRELVEKGRFTVERGSTLG